LSVVLGGVAAGWRVRIVRAREIGTHGTWWSTVALSLFNSFAASCAAYLLGVVIRCLGGEAEMDAQT
jgi:hypothetical protein